MEQFEEKTESCVWCGARETRSDKRPTEVQVRTEDEKEEKEEDRLLGMDHFDKSIQSWLSRLCCSMLLLHFRFYSPHVVEPEKYRGRFLGAERETT